MIKSLLLFSCILLTLTLPAATIIVKNLGELNAANKKAVPGDVILLENGEWRDVTLVLDCNGSREKPITFKARTAGKVYITGNSKLKIGGNFIIVDGLYFTEGYSGEEAVIEFRTNKNQVANNCRVTNTVINNFNNPLRKDDNNWVLFYGKSNRLDHCSFLNKKNIGVLLTVVLDDERSRGNFHSIDHNYFGKRMPLGSNGGEIIRVGVSQHCQFNSNTQITDNFFEYCDGETEVVSIKSGSNLVRNNVFKECQGSVVLRHGDNNTVENNIFLGNNKKGTGGVRVINKGQWVVNNFFYQCRGENFRSPLAIMNGIPNSPAHRYVQVTDAVIANNTFYNCAPASFGEGSDTERTLPPDKVLLANNIFYNTKDSIIFLAHDEIGGFRFSGNEASKAILQSLPAGFSKTNLGVQKNDNKPFPVSISGKRQTLPDSLQSVALQRLKRRLDPKPGFSDLALIRKLQANAYTQSGAKWFFGKEVMKLPKAVVVQCKTAEDIYAEIEKGRPAELILTGNDYVFYQPVYIQKKIKIKTSQQGFINMHTTPGLSSLFIIKGNGSLTLQGLKWDGSDVKSKHLVSSDPEGPSGHFNFSLLGCQLRYFSRNNGCENLFYAFQSTIADSIIIGNSIFSNNQVNGFLMQEEKENKGYYNAENVHIYKNSFTNQPGNFLDIYRGGNDESTLGPSLVMTDNSFDNCNTGNETPLIRLTGVQYSRLYFNSFADSNPKKILLQYEDLVRASHYLTRNLFIGCGEIKTNNFVSSEKNIIQ